MERTAARLRTAFQRHEQRHEDAARLTAALHAMCVEATFRRMSPAAIVVAMRRTWHLVPRPPDVTPEQWASAYYASLGRCLTSHFLRRGMSIDALGDSSATDLGGVPDVAVDPNDVVSAAVPLFVDEARRAIVASSGLAFGVSCLYASLSQWFGRDVRVFRTSAEAETWRGAVGLPVLTALLPPGDRRRRDRRRTLRA